MKKCALLAAVAILAACGRSDQPQTPQNATAAPKPVFKVKHIDRSVIDKLPLEAVQNQQSADGKPLAVYPIEGLPAQNSIGLVGKHANDWEALNGKCMQTDAAGAPLGWPAGGKCETLFKQLVANIAEDADSLSTYLIGHAALQPYQSGKSGYAAVQNGRYILEVDSEGAFYFRRRHY